jgi:hypothetical protein
MGNPVKNRSTVDIAEGDSATQIAQCLEGIDPEIAEEAYQKWVQALVTETEESEEGKRAADSQAGAVEDLKAEANEKSPIVEQASALGAEVAAVAKELSAISGMDMLKDCWALQRRRVGLLMDLEKSKGIISLCGHKEIAQLRRIAETFLKYEVKNTPKNPKGSGVETSPEVNPGSQKVVDPNCVNPKLLERLTAKIAEINSELEASEASLRYGDLNS